MKRFLALVVTLWAGIAQATVTGTVTENTYACNGSQTAYPTTFRFLAGTDLAVTKTTAGVTAALALTTDYTVTGAKAATGTVTLTAGSKCPNGSTLTITRTLPMTQGTAFRSQGSFSPALHEDAFDRLAMVDQQLSRDDGLARADIADLEAFVNGLAAGSQVVVPKTWTLAGDGTAVTFSLPAADLSSAASYYVTIDGLSQIPTSDFSVSGGADTITFTSAPPVGSVIEVRCLTYAKAQGVADSIEVTATGATTGRSLSDHFADTVNVFDFIPVQYQAAITARTSTVDVKAYVQAALDTSKGDVLFPPGRFWFTSGLSIPSGRTLRGQGKSTGVNPGQNGTYLDFSTMSDGNAALDFNGVSDVRVEGFYINGHGATGVAPDLYFRGNNRRVRLQDLAIVSQGSGVLLDFNSSGGSTINSVVENVVVAGGTAPAAVVVGAACTSIDFNSVYVNAATSSAGFQIGGTYITLHSCASDANLWGYYINYGKSVAIIGSGAETSGRSAIWARGVDGLAIVGFRAVANSSVASPYPSFLYFTDDAKNVTTMNTLDDGASVATYSIADDGVQVSDGSYSFIQHSSARPIRASSAMRHSRWGSNLDLGGRLSTRRVSAVVSGGAAQTIDASGGNEFVFTVTDTTAFTFSAPTNGITGQRITIRVRNGAGAIMGNITWNAIFKMAAFTKPTSGFSQAIDFQFDGTNWVEVSRTSTEVPV